MAQQTKNRFAKRNQHCDVTKGNRKSQNNPILQGVPEYMTQFQNFIKNKQVKIQQKLKYFLKGYKMPFQFSSLLQVVLKIVSLK